MTPEELGVVRALLQQVVEACLQRRGYMGEDALAELVEGLDQGLTSSGRSSSSSGEDAVSYCHVCGYADGCSSDCPLDQLRTVINPNRKTYCRPGPLHGVALPEKRA